MNVARSHRIGAASGAVGTALMFGGLTTITSALVGVSPVDSGDTIAAHYAAHADEIRRGVTLALGCVFLVIWFLAYLRRRVRASEGEHGWLGSVLFGGGLLGLGGVVLYLATLVAATNSSIVAAPEAARTLLILGWEYGGVLAPFFAALVGATSLAIIRYSMLPWLTRPVAWIGGLLAVALATPGFFRGFLVVLSIAWLCAVSVSLALARPPRIAVAAPQAGADNRGLPLATLGRG